MVGDGAAVLVARAFAAAGIEAPPDALERFVAIYRERLLRHTRPYPRIPEVLADLAQRAELALLTNKPLAATKDILDGLDLARFFGPAVVGRRRNVPAQAGPFGPAASVARRRRPPVGHRARRRFND